MALSCAIKASVIAWQVRVDMRSSIYCLTVVLALSCSAAAEAQSLRCNGQLVRDDDTMADVIAACGEPNFRDRWIANSGLGFGLPMSEWTYNPGPRRLIQTVVFRGDRVMQVNTAGYGFRENALPASGDCDPGLITPGLSKYQLLQACGPPLTQISYFITAKRVYEPGFSYPLARNGGRFVYRERWTYDFGGNRLRRLIQLDNARVVDVMLGNRGS